MAEKTPSYTDQAASQLSRTPTCATDECSSIDDDLIKDTAADQQVKGKKTGISISEALSRWYRTLAKSLWGPRDPMYMKKVEFSDKGRVLMKLVFVGDMWVGKSTFVVTAATGWFPTVYTPTVCDPYTSHIGLDVQGVPFECRLWDTSSDSHFERLRPLCYNKTDIFCICYSIGNPGSLDNVWNSWAPEIFYFRKKHDPIFLLGFQSDLRSDPATIESLSKENKAPVTREQGEEMARRIGAVGYLESSSIKYENTLGTIETMLGMVVEANPTLQKRCDKKKEARHEEKRRQAK